MSAQRDAAWLKSAAPADITAALATGELSELLGRPVPPQVPDAGQLGAEHLAQMPPADLAKAYEAGRCDALLGRAVASAP